jgi:hypothetical protein
VLPARADDLSSFALHFHFVLRARAFSSFSNSAAPFFFLLNFNCYQRLAAFSISFCARSGSVHGALHFELEARKLSTTVIALFLFSLRNQARFSLISALNSSNFEL